GPSPWRSGSTPRRRPATRRLGGTTSQQVECPPMDAIGSSMTTGTRVETPARDDVPPREWGWVLRVLALVVAFAVVTYLRSRQVDVPLRDPHGKLFSAKILSTLETLLVFVAV